MSRWSAGWSPMGAVVQGAVPSGPVAVRSQGLFVRGVVIAVYVYDSKEELVPGYAVKPNGVYVDVLTYGKHNTVLRRVMWTHGRSGLQEGDISLPRAATLSVNEDALDLSLVDPAALDGDHVAVGFLEDDLSQPFVVCSLSHPSSDLGNEDRDLGQRMRLVEADGAPRMIKHRGAAFGLDAGGNWRLDTRRAHGGAYQKDGTEPEPAEDGQHGNVVLQLPRGATVTIEIEGGANLTLTDKDGDAKLTLGDGAASVAVAEPLSALYKSLKDRFDTHVHPYAFGPTGAPTTPAPAWDGDIVSDKAKIPRSG